MPLCNHRFLGYCPVCSQPVEYMDVPKNELTRTDIIILAPKPTTFLPCGCKSHTYEITNGLLVAGSAKYAKMLAEQEIPARFISNIKPKE